MTQSPGSYIYGDVAVGPDGEAYVTWWDYSSANAIRGAICKPPAETCSTSAAWAGPTTVASLDATGGAPVPFACPIVAQPGGRAAPSPQVEVDHSGRPQNGRVYVTWGDLRSGSGVTRCAEEVNGNGTPPLVTHLSWDSFVDSAPGTLPTGGNRTRLLTDGEGGGQSSSDDWFPWLAIDQTNGQAAAGFYSTRDDATRRTTNFYARWVGSEAGVLGPLTRVSGAPSDYSTQPCCTFGNDYGDYTGTDATSGLTYLVWSDKRASGGDGEAFTDAVSLAGPQSQPPPPPPSPPPPAESQTGGQPPTPVAPAAISPTPAPATIAPSIAFLAGQRTITATRRGSFSYSLTATPAALAGGISFQTTSAIAAARRRRLNLGFKPFTTPVRGSTTVTVKLSRGNFTILRRRRSLRVRATAAIGSVRRNVIFTLRAPRGR